MPNPTIALKGIDEVTVLELSEHLPAESVSTESVAADAEAGELATTLIILVGVPAIKGLVDWLLKDRTTEEEEKTIEFTDGSGAIHRETIRTLKRSSKSKEGLIQQIAKLCGIEIPGEL